MDRFAERIAHLDMDAFFVEVERLGDPSLRGVPVAVGGAGNRGVVASASYEARRMGVHSAMPMAHARRRCPALRVVAPDQRAYGEASKRVFAILRSFTPAVEPLSVDEAFLDIGGLRLHYDAPAAVADAMRAAIREETRLPSSVGIATVKLLAKLASQDAKPDGVLVVPAGGELEYLHPKPVRALWGVGEATYARLEQLGIRTVGDLASVPEETLVRRLGPSLGAHLSALSNARDPREVEPGGGAKSISVEQTFETDLEGRASIETELLRIADRLALRLHRARLVAATVTLKVRFEDFSTITRSHTQPTPLDTAHDLYSAALALLDRAAIGDRPVRLLGLGGDGLEDATAPRQLDLAGSDWGDLEGAVEAVRLRFGDDAVAPARLVEAPPPPDPDDADAAGT
ncbi:MAG: DNA polymerase IV, partial [Acidimicrobiia bacterium]|nr:DNA polymerase IV [Acidimicrobiia bacterium]